MAGLPQGQAKQAWIIDWWCAESLQVMSLKMVTDSVPRYVEKDRKERTIAKTSRTGGMWFGSCLGMMSISWRTTALTLTQATGSTHLMAPRHWEIVLVCLCHYKVLYTLGKSSADILIPSWHRYEATSFMILSRKLLHLHFIVSFTPRLKASRKAWMVVS